MIATISQATAAHIATVANREGWADVFGRKVRPSDVLEAWTYGTHEHESFASFVLQEVER